MRHTSLVVPNALLLLLWGSLFFFLLKSATAADSTITATVQISVCGNGNKENGEQCDGSDFGAATCPSLGFSGGSLTCSIACDYDTSGCSTQTTQGGGGGGGSIIPPITPTPSGAPSAFSRVDINADAKVDLIDFSILAYWWGREVVVNAPYDLNSDGRVTLADFSILAYYWTMP